MRLPYPTCKYIMNSELKLNIKASSGILESTINFAKRLSHHPNAPYLHDKLTSSIIQELSLMGIEKMIEGDSYSRGAYGSDDYCLYVHFRRGDAKTRMIFDSHIDHPGFVLNGKGSGIALGSIGYKRIESLVAENPIELQIFNKEGDYLSIGNLVEFNFKRKPIAKIESESPIPQNSHGIWNINGFSVDSENIYMYAADNMIATFLMLALIERIALNPDEFPDIDAIFIFSFVEEVFELSASAVARKRSTPFGDIDEDCSIIILECMQCVPMPSQRTNVSSMNTGKDNLRDFRLEDDDRSYNPAAWEINAKSPTFHELYRELELPMPSYDSGILIKLNDTDCVYGYQFHDQPNMAESLLLYAADYAGIDYQHTISSGACNATAYSIFPTTSNIVTLNIPNPYKHNLYSDGSIAPEQIKIADLESAIKTTLILFELANSHISRVHPNALCQKLKKTSLNPGAALTTKLRRERNLIVWNASWRLKHRSYFAETIADKMAINLRTGALRILEQLYRIV